MMACPFCGHTVALVSHVENSDRLVAGCSGCFAISGTPAATGELAVALWHQRIAELTRDYPAGVETDDAIVRAKYSPPSLRTFELSQFEKRRQLGGMRVAQDEIEEIIAKLYKA
jgi:hypothetical protein